MNMEFKDEKYPYNCTECSEKFSELKDATEHFKRFFPSNEKLQILLLFFFIQKGKNNLYKIRAFFNSNTVVKENIGTLTS